MMGQFNKGITVISLIVTVIVTLILTGVGIAVFVDDEGIVKESKSAKTEAEIKGWEEKIDEVIFRTENNKVNPELEDIIEELKKSGIIAKKEDVDRETGDIKTVKPSYIISGKLEDYINKAALIIDPNSGEYAGSVEPVKIRGKEGEIYTLGDVNPREGYTVTFNAGEGEVTQTTITASKIFNKWNLEGVGKIDGNKYTFGDDEGIITAQYIYGDITFPEAIRYGYIFNGWYTNPSGGIREGGQGDT